MSTQEFASRYHADKALAERYGVHRVTVWRWARESDFPKPVSLGPGCKRWKGADVLAWEARKEAA